MQLSEVTRERDRYAAQTEDLREQANAAQREADDARNSVIAEKKELEDRFQREREAKETAKRALAQRMDELTKKKGVSVALRRQAIWERFDLPFGPLSTAFQAYVHLNALCSLFLGAGSRTYISTHTFVDCYPFSALSATSVSDRFPNRPCRPVLL